MAEGFSALYFRWRDHEVIDAAEEAAVLEIVGKPYAVGDRKPAEQVRGVKHAVTPLLAAIVG